RGPRTLRHAIRRRERHAFDPRDDVRGVIVGTGCGANAQAALETAIEELGRRARTACPPARKHHPAERFAAAAPEPVDAPERLADVDAATFEAGVERRAIQILGAALPDRIRLHGCRLRAPVHAALPDRAARVQRPGRAPRGVGLANGVDAERGPVVLDPGDRHLHAPTFILT